MDFRSRIGLHGQGQMQNGAGFFRLGVPLEAWPRNHILYLRGHVCGAKACAWKEEAVQHGALYRRDFTTVTERTHDEAGYTMIQTMKMAPECLDWVPGQDGLLPGPAIESSRRMDSTRDINSSQSLRFANTTALYAG